MTIVVDILDIGFDVIVKITLPKEDIFEFFPAQCHPSPSLLEQRLLL